MFAKGIEFLVTDKFTRPSCRFWLFQGWEDNMGKMSDPEITPLSQLGGQTRCKAGSNCKQLKSMGIAARAV